MLFSELPKADESGRKYELDNARIASVTISNDDHGILTAWLHCEWRSSGCGFGGYVLGNGSGSNLADDGRDLSRRNWGANWIVRCLNTVLDSGYGSWDDLEGKPIRILHGGIGGTIVAIGHFIDDKWFCPKVEFAKYVKEDR